MAVKKSALRMAGVKSGKVQKKGRKARERDIPKVRAKMIVS